MESGTIHSLTDDLLVTILTRSFEQPVSREPHLDILTADAPPVVMPHPPPAADVAQTLLIASVCRRWRRLAKRRVTTVSVKEGAVVSLHDLSVVVACFPRLTHLHLCDNSSQAVHDAFLSLLASSCPNLTKIHVGRSFARPRLHIYLAGSVKHYRRKEERHITTEGLGRFFRTLPGLELVTLFCLRQATELPSSYFQLRHLHTFLLTDASALENPGFTNLTALTTLYVTFPMNHRHLSTLLRLPQLAHLSTADPHQSHHPAAAASVALPSGLKLLNLSLWCPVFDTIFPSPSPSPSQSPSPSPFTGLEQLLITTCSELESLPDSIGDLMPCLRQLTIRECYYFTHLPDSVTSLSHLEALSISNSTQFTLLPSNLGHLPALKLLNLEDLCLAEFPPSFCSLTSLEALSVVDCNDLPQLPAGFASLTALKALCLSNSYAIALPQDVGPLARLEALRLYIYLYPLPPSFTQLFSLTTLHLEQCGGNELPEALGELSSLRELKIVDSLITTLPTSLTRLSRLVTLHVTRCKSLSNVPSSLDMLLGLKTLEVTVCPQLSTPPDGLPPCLETLCVGPLRECASHVVDISHLLHLRVLKLSCVGVRCGSAGSSSLSCLEQLEVHVEGDRQELPLPLAFTCLPRLRTLLIQAPGMCTLPESVVAVLPALRQLKIMSWSPEELPESVLELTSLTSLTIHAPHLLSLPQHMSCLSRLRTLELIRCSALQHLPGTLTQLHHLILHDTPIAFLPANFEQLVERR